MDIKELKEKAVQLSPLISRKDSVDYINIENYVLSTLGLEKSEIENPEIFYKNFVYLMCHLYRDINEIENRLADYRTRYHSLENVKNNKAEFERRKLIFFCDLNKEALQEIDSFIANGISAFLLEHSYDILNRECERDALSDLHYRNRYKFAWHRDYYSIDYPFAIIVKVSQYAREKYHFEQVIDA